ncbi:hypothetical protein IT413_03795 [Candidatus Peregrinibacteria bacterium]|nr:hypothetical protein [Candidatus Peregrinibacteria bacterium]
MDTTSLQNFLLALETSGLPADRKAYWISKLSSNDASAGDEDQFMAEMTQHLQMLDSSIEFVEGALASDEARLRALKEQSLPYLERLTETQDDYNNSQYKAFTGEILGAEKEMMASLEGMRKTGETDEIAALRAKLLTKKP